MLYQAYEVRGYSTVELARVLGCRNAYNLYRVMRSETILRKLQRRRQPKIEIHRAMETALKKVGLSFLQWVNSHELPDPFAIADALRRPVDRDNPMSVYAHAAYKQDFRTLYHQVYGLPHPPGRPHWEAESGSPRPYTQTIRWDDVEGHFICSLDEIAGCVATGRTREEAFNKMNRRYVFINSIVKLKLLPDRSQVFEDHINRYNREAE